ncbi:histidine kinase [Piscinibacter sp. XHJ-5]|uniref:sensor histidine kinase n=1 Tax=Piscinibacter sp. XHJ-5 TaxID=3037797 RepID=UPI0024530567|nr:histidine kinase [Piscinibacter sp. XHJ-5]
MNAVTSLIPRSRWRPLVRRGVGIGALGLFIALVLTIVYRHEFWPTLVYSLSITMSCWVLIDSGRVLAARWVHRHRRDCEQYGQWPGWPWMVGIVIAGTILGYTAGTALGNWFTGLRMPGLAVDSVQQALALLLFAMVPSVAMTYFFYSRERLASSEAQAQTAQRQAAENQLKLLESQLEPHMLFNTLANLRVLIGIDPPRAQAMLDRLIAFLRATLEASRSGSHSLATEFARIADYLELMKVRMGERLQPRLELPRELADVTVPPLLLQPLVENAIKHGLEPHVGGGRLIVSAAREGDALVLRVRDTGAGLSDASGDGTHFGLRQVRERLATLHGGAASLDLAAASDAEGGTLATVTLPLR